MTFFPQKHLERANYISGTITDAMNTEVSERNNFMELQF